MYRIRLRRKCAFLTCTQIIYNTVHTTFSSSVCVCVGEGVTNVDDLSGFFVAFFVLSSAGGTTCHLLSLLNNYPFLYGDEDLPVVSRVAVSRQRRSSGCPHTAVSI